MSVYDEIGVRPFINAGGWGFTRYGGSIMPGEVVAAMAEASQQFVNIFDLQDRMGEAIAALTQNEAAYVCCGAASGILLAVATCIAGTDAALADRLPRTAGLRDGVIVARCQRGTESDAMVRAAGGRIVEVGVNERPATADDYLGAMDETTAAILLIAFEGQSVGDVVALVRAARRRGVRVIVDGACALRPKENLWRYTREMGVEAFVTSGGKAMRGPQSSGLVLGTRAMIEGCKFHGAPNLRIGRGMKVGKEEFAGIFTALKLFLARDFDAERAQEERVLHEMAAGLAGLANVRVRVVEQSRAEIDLGAGISAEAVAKAMLDGEPSILLRGREGRVTIAPSLLAEGEERVVVERLRAVIGSMKSEV